MESRVRQKRFQYSPQGIKSFRIPLSRSAFIMNSLGLRAPGTCWVVDDARFAVRGEDQGGDCVILPATHTMKCWR